MKTIQDDIDEELLPLFLEEAVELYSEIGNTLQAWCELPTDNLLKRKLLRSLHTFKGSARMAGAMRVGHQVHKMEEQAASAMAKRPALFRDELRSQLDLIGQMIEHLRTDATIENSPPVIEKNTGRHVPFSSIGKRLYRVVRLTGKELGKKANLELYGTEIELERNVLDRITTSFEHLLRNAIAHGLENPRQRESAGKPPIGDIRLSLTRINDEAVFEFADDGAGLDVDGLRSRAIEMNLLPPDSAASDGQVMQLVFVPGLSTATKITAISGRGVGMDVVRSEITALGGHITVSSISGRGTRFMIRLPLHQNTDGSTGLN